jgi:N-acetylglutamate synthase-like GNAT family acetyltransferase
MKAFDQLSVVPFSTELREYFASLNREWIEKYFEMEEKDKHVLINPEEAIINYGGEVFFVLCNQRVVGTCALVKANEEVFEISKMAVTEEFQSMGIGTLLMAHVTAMARVAGMKELILYSNTGLKKAIRMYTRFGFKEVPKTDFHSKRSNIKMSLLIKTKVMLSP